MLSSLIYLLLTLICGGAGVVTFLAVFYCLIKAEEFIQHCYNQVR